jgi:hypothetical protein
LGRLGKVGRRKVAQVSQVRVKGKDKVNYPTLANDGLGWGTLRSVFSPHPPEAGRYGTPAGWCPVEKPLNGAGEVSGAGVLRFAQDDPC